MSAPEQSEEKVRSIQARRKAAKKAAERRGCTGVFFRDGFLYHTTSGREELVSGQEPIGKPEASKPEKPSWQTAQQNPRRSSSPRPAAPASTSTSQRWPYRRYEYY